MTFRCAVCREKFTPAVPPHNPDLPGYCDECIELEELTQPSNPLEGKIYSLRIGGSLFFPVTADDPQPWETLRAEIRKARWARLSRSLCVHRVQRGDAYITDRESVDFESQDGARVYKTLTFEDLSLGVEYVEMVTSNLAGTHAEAQS